MFYQDHFIGNHREFEIRQFNQMVGNMNGFIELALILQACPRHYISFVGGFNLCPAIIKVIAITIPTFQHSE